MSQVQFLNMIVTKILANSYAINLNAILERVSKIDANYNLSLSIMYNQMAATSMNLYTDKHYILAHEKQIRPQQEQIAH